jgi:uncharacterized protein (DUF4213/DUF364 family)
MKKKIKNQDIEVKEGANKLPFAWVYENGKKIKVTNPITLAAFAEVERRGIHSYKKYTVKEFFDLMDQWDKKRKEKFKKDI